MYSYLQGLIKPIGTKTPPRKSDRYEPIAIGGSRGGPVVWLEQATPILAQSLEYSYTQFGTCGKAWGLTSPQRSHWLRQLVAKIGGAGYPQSDFCYCYNTFIRKFHIKRCQFFYPMIFSS